MSVLNNGYGPVESIPLRQLRARAATLGIQGQTREEIIRAFAAREVEIAELRRRCARQGLATSGDMDDLLLRLASNTGGITRAHRWVYRAIAITVAGLGFAGLVVSLPHVAQALTRIMGVSAIHAYLLALIVDGGICAFKLIEALAERFHVRPVRVVVGAGLICALALSAVLNATEFAQHASDSGGVVLACLLAVFLAAFVYVNFLVSSYLLLHCSPRKEENPLSPAQTLRDAAATLEKLTTNARRFSG
jgi:hypothetical protein